MAQARIYCPECDSDYPLRYDVATRAFYCLECEFIMAVIFKRTKPVTAVRPVKRSIRV